MENSLAAFREAIRLGADGVELDVHTALSGELVVHHDPNIPGVGPLCELNLDSIRKIRLPNHEPIPTLDEALEAIGSAVRRLGGSASPEAWIELKALPPSADEALFDSIDRATGPTRCAVHSFDHRIIARIGEKRPMLRRGVLSKDRLIDPIAPLRAAGASALWQEWHLIDAELVEAVHQEGGEVIAWTVNDIETARHLARLGVDGLCGNWPERLKVW